MAKAISDFTFNVCIGIVQITQLHTCMRNKIVTFKEGHLMW